MNRNDVLISVIIPVYGVERFVEKCVRSLMEQTLTESVEFIFIDDATPDRSMSIIDRVTAEYPHRKEQIRILHHAVNKGLPAARNTGLDAAAGEYVVHFDSDDFADRQMLRLMAETVRNENIDLAWCDLFLSFEKRERLMATPSFTTADDALRGMLSGAMKYNVWNKIARRSLYTDNGIRFPEGHGMGEDMTMLMVAACAEKVAHINTPLYHYMKLNGEAFTNNALDRRKINDIIHNVDRTSQFILKHKGDGWARDLDFFRLSIKFPWLLTADKANYRLWRETFTESDGAIGRNPSEPVRNVLLQKLALHKCDMLIKAYYHVVYKFIYGIIYR